MKKIFWKCTIPFAFFLIAIAVLVLHPFNAIPDKLGKFLIK